MCETSMILTGFTALLVFTNILSAYKLMKANKKISTLESDILDLKRKLADKTITVTVNYAKKYK